MEKLTNRTFDEIEVGDSASLTRTVTERDIGDFAAASGDYNPSHVDPEFAQHTQFGKVVVHGMWTGSLISALLGMQLPGPGTVYLGQQMRFKRAVFPGDTVTARVTVTDKRGDKPILTLACSCVNQSGEEVLSGEAVVMAPTAKLSANKVVRSSRFASWFENSDAATPMKCAVVHPCSESSIAATVEARDAGLFDPVLVGPRTRIEQAAVAANVSLEGMTIVDALHSHDAAAKAVRMAADGDVTALMKGSLHSDELLSAVIAREGGLRTDRFISHVFVLDVPTYDKLLMVTDGALNIAPTLDQKRDITQNAIDLAHHLGIPNPKVAVLAAVETVTPSMQSTLDAAALTMMSRRGQITGGVVDGPLAFDNAIDPEAAESKGIKSEVAGHADILLAPDIEAGNIAAKQLQYLAKADAAGIVLGAKVPVILTSRADGVRARMASIALARRIAGLQRVKGG